MRLAIISDIHSNIQALEKVLSAIDNLGIDQIYCLGDIVGYGPFPNECVEIVRKRCTLVIKGNHDSGVTGELELDHFNQFGRSAIIWTQKNISPDNLVFLKGLPLSASENGCTLAHATPHEPESWQYILSWRDAQECFESFGTPLAFIGHTHSPVIIGEDGKINQFRKDCRFLTNVGSVGQPRDGNPKASFCMADTTAWKLEIVRVEYDIEAAAAASLKARLPDFLAQRLFLGV
jgi:diadenosine tetraphosphatase ApaH/serine/threonine PP2A family protein phosphatase